MAVGWLGTISDAWLGGYKKMFSYTGRSRRRDYGFYMLIQLILFIAIMMLAIVVGKATGNVDHPVTLTLVCVHMFFWFLGTLAYNVRRCHDAGASGWWCLLYLGFGAFVIGGLLVVPPSLGDNRYGPNPRTID